MYGFNFSQYRCDSYGNLYQYHTNNPDIHDHYHPPKEFSSEFQPTETNNTNQEDLHTNHNKQNHNHEESPKNSQQNNKKKNNDQLVEYVCSTEQLPVNPYKTKSNRYLENESQTNDYQNNMSKDISLRIINQTTPATQQDQTYTTPQKNDNQHQQKDITTSNNYQDEYHGHKYVEGEYSAKPFVNYYRNDLLSNKQANQANHISSNQQAKPNYHAQEHSHNSRENQNNESSNTQPDDNSFSI